MKRSSTTRLKPRAVRKSSTTRKVVQIGSELRNAQSGDMFTLCIRQQLGAECVRELQFDAVRKWRFDYAIPSVKLAIEIDGGVWIEGGGRHTRGSGWIKDQEKMNAAAAQGWRVMHFTPQQQLTSYALNCIRDALRFSSVEAQCEKDLPINCL